MSTIIFLEKNTMNLPLPRAVSQQSRTLRFLCVFMGIGLVGLYVACDLVEQAFTPPYSRVLKNEVIESSNTKENAKPNSPRGKQTKQSTMQQNGHVRSLKQLSPSKTHRSAFVQDMINIHRMKDGEDDFDCEPLEASAAQPMEGILSSGRFGNHLSAAANLINYAKKEDCDFDLHPKLLGGWTPKRTTGRFRSTDATDSKNKNCTLPSADYAKVKDIGKAVFSSCAISMLSSYFAINATHVFDRVCPMEEPYSVLHVRSGDITGGHYDEKGFYKPRHVQIAMSPSLTSYYIAVVKDIVARHQKNGKNGAPKIFVLCLNMNNPTCEYFEKVAGLFQHEVQFEFRVGKNLIDDLHIFLCAREVAVSAGTFKYALLMSQHLQKVYEFSWAQMSKEQCASESQQTTKYWIADEGEADHFKKTNRWWANTAYQRHTMDAYYKMTSCEE